jgi:capsular exopolysaccharide synthesis family protein
LGLIEEDKSGPAMDPASANGALGIIPQVQARYSKDILLNDADQPFVREQFRTLKVRLSTLERTGRGRVITISSPFIEEGKSLLSANLAYVCAEDPDRRVLLIDGDLRRSSLHTYLGVDRVPGVTDYLTQEGLEPHCFMRRSGRLYWMSSGFLAPNPIELLSSDNMAELIEYSRKHFDLVIIDCPPLEPVSDTSVLTDLSDGLVLVVRSGKTSYGSAERALRNVDPNRVLGIVLNGVQPMAFNTYHGRHYYYGGKHAYPSVDQDSE